MERFERHLGPGHRAPAGLVLSGKNPRGAALNLENEQETSIRLAPFIGRSVALCTTSKFGLDWYHGAKAMEHKGYGTW